MHEQSRKGTATQSMVKHAMVKLSFAFLFVTAARSFDVIAPPAARARTRKAFSGFLCNGPHTASAFSRLGRPLRLPRLCPSELPQLCSHNLLLRLVRMRPEGHVLPQEDVKSWSAALSEALHALLVCFGPVLDPRGFCRLEANFCYCHCC